MKETLVADTPVDLVELLSDPEQTGLLWIAQQLHEIDGCVCNKCLFHDQSRDANDGLT